MFKSLPQLYFGNVYQLRHAIDRHHHRHTIEHSGSPQAAVTIAEQE